MLNKLAFTLILLVIFNASTSAQELKFKISGIPDTTIHLVKYLGSRLLYADTAELKKGVVTFDGNKQEPGILAVLLPDKKYFEFIHNNEEVYIETKGPDFVGNMKVKKSEENKILHEYLVYLRKIQEETNKIKEQRDELDKSQSKKIEKLTEQIVANGNLVSEYQKKIVEENRGKLVAKIVNMAIAVDVPEPPTPEDSTFRYRYFRDHYFDNVDLHDDRLINTPMVQRKLEYYYSSKVLLQHPDTIIKYMSKIFDELDDESKMFRFLVTNTTAHFQKSNIMGMDRVTTAFIAKYYCGPRSDGKPRAYDWMDTEKLTELCNTNKVRKRLVMGEVPPNVILTDSTSKNWYDFYSLEKDYIILYFWDPNCGHCKKQTPKLQKLYEEKLKDRNVEIFAVGKATGDDYEDWKKFIRKKELTFINVGLTEEIYQLAKTNPSALIPEKTTLESVNYQQTYDLFATPRMWILDKDKKIIANKLGVAQTEEFLDRLQGFEDAEKLFEIKKDDEEKVNFEDAIPSE